MFRTLRSTLVSGAAFFRTPSNATTAIAGMMEIEAKHRAETESWVNPEALASGKDGAFDACDLRHWLALAHRAGVRAVPAKQLLVLTEDQMYAASGTLAIPDNAITRRLSTSLKHAADALEITTYAEPAHIERAQPEEQRLQDTDKRKTAV